MIAALIRCLQGVYAPGRAQGRQVIYYENALNTRVSNILKEFNNTLKATSGFNYGTYTNTLMKRVNYTYNNVRKVTGTSVQTVEAEDVSVPPPTPPVISVCGVLLFFCTSSCWRQ